MDVVSLDNEVLDAVYFFSMDLELLLKIESLKSLIFFFCSIICIFSFALAIDDDSMFSIDCERLAFVLSI